MILGWGVLAAAGVVALAFCPLLRGEHGPLAGPVAMMALALGWLARLLGPLGGVWLWASAAGAPPAPRTIRWLARLSGAVGAVITVVMAFAAVAAAGALLALG